MATAVKSKDSKRFADPADNFRLTARNTSGYSCDMESSPLFPHFDTISRQLCGIRHQTPLNDGRKPAAVAMVLSGAADDLQMLLIERSHDERDPWSGNLALPGGRIERGESAHQAAVRETMEEIGLDLTTGQHLGRLADITGAHLPVRISCFVYGFANKPAVQLNHEASDAFWVSLSELYDPQRRVRTNVHFRESVHHVPAIRLSREDKPVLWGITYRLALQFLEATGHPASVDFPLPVHTDSAMNSATILHQMEDAP